MSIIDKYLDHTVTREYLTSVSRNDHFSKFKKTSEYRRDTLLYIEDIYSVKHRNFDGVNEYGSLFGEETRLAVKGENEVTVFLTETLAAIYSCGETKQFIEIETGRIPGYWGNDTIIKEKRFNGYRYWGPELCKIVNRYDSKSGQVEEHYFPELSSGKNRISIDEILNFTKKFSIVKKDQERKKMEKKLFIESMCRL
ncbi:MAG: hypothetical protein LBU89_12375 [Fibromonadaceae bacterium]|nr:hypothetical protein [Fibromonadaceae bacterium]